MLATQLSKLVWSLRLQGPVGTVRTSATALRRKLQPATVAEAAAWADEEQWFDKRFGVTTAGCVEVTDLDIDPAVKDQSVEYQPTSVVATTAALASLPIRRGDYDFVDLGCGKGRALVIAHKLGFHRLTGVELSPTLAEIAQSNADELIWRHGDCSIRVINGNALDCEFPERPLVVFLFNPFGQTVVEKVEQRLRASLEQSPRDCWVVYANAVHRDVFDDSSFWSETLFDGEWWGIYRYSQQG